MSIKRKIMLCLVVWILCQPITFAQETIKLTFEQAEKQFLEKNRSLLAERYNIDIADAAIVQAKLLDNPTLTAGDLNFWKANAAEELGLSKAAFGNRIVYSVELEQMIRTAGKRRKLVAMEKTSKEIAIKEFESFLLELKTELRTNLHEIIYLQSYLDINYLLQESVKKMVQAYKNQTASGNIAKSETVRLQASLIELETEANELLTELHQLVKTLKVLLFIPPETELSLLPSETVAKNPTDMQLLDLIEIAKNARPEFLLSDLNISFHAKLLTYEKSQQTPDIGLILNYDRYGGVWKNFAGVGVRFDIPVFNRNQGNIKMAKLKAEQSAYQSDYQKNAILNEVAKTFEHYTLKYHYYQQLMENNISNDLESMFEAYQRNLLNKNIAMLEYIDFMYAYKTTKQAIILAKKNLDVHFEALQLSINHKL